jgi:imidazolonepropionase-like amidohydrolase
MGMSCAEAWRAVTLEAAYSCGFSDRGMLRAGARGDLAIWDGDDHRQIIQHYGMPHVGTVIVGGEVAWTR